MPDPRSEDLREEVPAVEVTSSGYWEVIEDVIKRNPHIAGDPDAESLALGILIAEDDAWSAP